MISLNALLIEARRHGVTEVLLGLVADATAPVVVRERALGRVLVALAGADVAESSLDWAPQPAGPTLRNPVELPAPHALAS